MPHSTLLDDLRWRYATKHFDRDKTIPADVWAQLEESLVLTPSSYGLQPWIFLVVTERKTKEMLLPHAWNQAQVTDCSHFVIFAARTSLDTEYIDLNFSRTSELRGTPVESMQGYRNMIVKDLVHGARSGVTEEWAARQAYIALGQFMLACATLRVDACPMEGFAPAEFDKILGLTPRGLTDAVCCAAGYRSPTDKYAHLPKVRFPKEKMVEYI